MPLIQRKGSCATCYLYMLRSEAMKAKQTSGLFVSWDFEKCVAKTMPFNASVHLCGSASSEKKLLKSSRTYNPYTPTPPNSMPM